MPTPYRATVYTMTTFLGVSDLARETGYSQPYVSKLLRRGCSPADIRERAEWTREKRAIQAAMRAALYGEPEGHRQRN
jgi:hypothetical protein